MIRNVIFGIGIDFQGLYYANQPQWPWPASLWWASPHVSAHGTSSPSGIQAWALSPCWRYLGRIASLQCSLAVHAADSHPDAWTDFLAGSWTYFVTTDLFGDPDLCCSVSRWQWNGVLASEGTCLATHAWHLPPHPFRVQPAVTAPWQAFWRLADSVLLL